MSWFEKLWTNASRFCANISAHRHDIPEGLWRRCEHCGAVIYYAELERNLWVCPKCEFHMQISARQRLGIFLDQPGALLGQGEQPQQKQHNKLAGQNGSNSLKSPNNLDQLNHQSYNLTSTDSPQELVADLKPVDWLHFRDLKRYQDRITEAQKRTGEKDALIVMVGKVLGVPLVCSCFDFNFIGGSMGGVVGEKFVRGVEYALEHHLPLVNFAASGGARMQEGLISLMQMAKTSAALAKLAAAQLPYISILTHPTTGGVSASLAMLGDLILAEPGATIGFAGRRVIEQTIHQQLPEDFQSSEFLLEHGAIDRIVPRRLLRAEVAMLLGDLLHR